MPRTRVPAGATTRLLWSSFPGATACTASGPGWSGAVAPSGSTVVGPFAAGTYTFMLTCTAPGVSASYGRVNAIISPVGTPPEPP